ncbi:caspase recruitment domain-containing protein 11-like isoform X2 [Ciona intestinalis]
MSSTLDSMLGDSSDKDDMDWQGELQLYRMHIVERIRYCRISAALQSKYVIDMEDNEEILNPYTYRTEQMRLNHMVDILLRKGEENYKKFLQILGSYYPDVYKEIIGKDLPECELVDNVSNNHGSDELVELLMQALDRMKEEQKLLTRKLRRSNNLLEQRTHELERNKQKVEDLTERVDRYDEIDSEMATFRREVDRLKTENYTVCMRLIDTNEENTKLRESNMKLKNENDKVKAELQKLESCVAMERHQSVRLRNRLQCSPTERDLNDMKREIDELKIKLAQAHSKRNLCDGDVDTRIQMLQQDKKEAIEMYASALESLAKLREDCAAAEALRNKYLDEKEQAELTCAVLQSDCDMFKMRRDSVWQQLKEVEKEREILMRERNDAQHFAKDCMEEKAKYRAQIRSLEEKYDKLSQDLLQKERELCHLKSSNRPKHKVADTQWTGTDKFISRRSNSYSTCTASSTSSQHEIMQDCSDISSECETFRERTYITKHYEKYLKKIKIFSKIPLGNFGEYCQNVLPGIELAADYGPGDADETPFSKPTNEKYKKKWSSGSESEVNGPLIRKDVIRRQAIPRRTDTDITRSATNSNVSPPTQEVAISKTL